MRRIIYDVAVSLDGFIAGPGGDISAFPAEGDHLAPYLDRLAGYRTVVMGRGAYEFGYRFGLKPGARAYAHMDHHVFSRRLSVPDPCDVTVVRENWAGALAALRDGDGGDIYLCGGGAFAGFAANLGLIDLLRLRIAPVAIGSGVRLFEGLTAPCRFERRLITPYANGVALEEYAIVPAFPPMGAASPIGTGDGIAWTWRPAPGSPLRRGEDRDASALAAIYRRAVERSGARHYSPEQVDAWLSLAPTANRLAAMMADGRLRLVAMDCHDVPVGFVDLKPDGHLHYLYVDPAAGGAGRGAALLSAAVEAARTRGLQRVYAEASETALQCFLRLGFVRAERRDLTIGGVGIHNHAVGRSLGGESAANSPSDLTNDDLSVLRSGATSRWRTRDTGMSLMLDRATLPTHALCLHDGHLEPRTATLCNRRFQSKSSNLRAASSDEAGFWPVTSLPSVTTKDAQSAPFT